MVKHLVGGGDRITAAWAAIEALKESELELLFQELGFNKPELQLPITASMARGLRDRLDLVKDQKAYTEQSLVMATSDPPLEDDALKARILSTLVEGGQASKALCATWASKLLAMRLKSDNVVSYLNMFPYPK